MERDSGANFAVISSPSCGRDPCRYHEWFQVQVSRSPEIGTVIISVDGEGVRLREIFLPEVTGRWVGQVC